MPFHALRIGTIRASKERFMRSFDLQNWMRIETMNRKTKYLKIGGRQRWILCSSIFVFPKSLGAVHGEPPPPTLDAHRDHEPCGSRREEAPSENYSFASIPLSKK